MNPRIGRRSTLNLEKRQIKNKVVSFIEKNSHKVIGIREEFVYLEDVKTAMNINALEQRMGTKKWVLELLNKKYDKDYIIRKINESAELDRHRLFRY